MSKFPVLEAFASGREVIAEGVTLEDGREVQISLDRIDDGRGGEPGTMGTLLTLRDTESALQLGQELEVSRRLAAIGRLILINPVPFGASSVHLDDKRQYSIGAAPQERVLRSEVRLARSRSDRAV